MYLTDCPICDVHPVHLPDHVCQHCADKYKKECLIECPDIIYTRNDSKFQQQTFAREATPSYMIHPEEGLSAHRIMEKILNDNDNPTFAAQRAWHRRRIAFLCDCIVLLSKRDFFAPHSRKQINHIVEMASNIWLAENRVNHLFDIWNTLKFLYPLEMRNQEQRTEELLSLLLCSPDDLSIYEIPYIIAEDFSDADWIPLYRKHFADILQCWADNQASN